MITKDVVDGVPLKMWTEGVPVEFAAMQQLENLAKMKDLIFKHVAVMPDVHVGVGATIGSVIATQKVIIPAACGVDLGCGLIAARLDGVKASQLPDNLRGVRDAIEAAVPVGRANFEHIGTHANNVWRVGLKKGYDRLCHEYPEIADKTKPLAQLGTLGGGNHFIEICLDESDDVWLMLHSGSRGIGNRIGTHFIGEAKRDMERHNIHLPDKDLAYLNLGSDVFDDYMTWVHWAQDYAMHNRSVMMHNVIQALRMYAPFPNFTYAQTQAVACHHNYVSKETHFGENVYVTRKGAVRADRGMLGIIPGSMGAKSFIVRGKGAPESFNSCSHGAGRRFSRGEAKRTISLEDFRTAMAGVESRLDESVLDEAPQAYKDVDAVLRAQQDLVEIVHTLKQVVCIKG